MMTTVNFKMDSQVKKRLEEFTSAIGVSMSALFNMFINKTLQDGEIPFKPGTRSDYSKKMEGIQNMLEDGGCLSDVAQELGFKTPEDLYKWCTNERRKGRKANLR